MSDPDSQKEPEPPAKPPRPSQIAQSQLEADEMYARQLAEHYSGEARRGPSTGRTHDPVLPTRQREANIKSNELYDDRERSFIDGMVLRRPRRATTLTKTHR